MSKLNAGDRVRIKERPNWYMPTGYKLANLEGQVFEVLDEPEGYVLVLVDKDVIGLDTRVPLGFRADALERV